MKKEGTGKPANPVLTLDAGVRMDELRFEKVPDPEVRFRGNTPRNSVWTSRRVNLPDEVREGVVYRDAGIRLRIATEVVENPSEQESSSGRGRVKTRSKNVLVNTVEQEPRNEKEKK
jgi:hypothetical protein